MLDLACGTGQLGFALHGRFREVWAADLEPDMIALVRAKATGRDCTSVRPVLAAAEDLIAPAGSFLLVTIGNAFHRMQREAVAANVFRWLRPGGWLALVWGGSPWDGDQAWQAALRAVMARWQDRVAARAGDRIPAGYEQARRPGPTWRSSAPPDSRSRTRRRYRAAHEWTPDSIAGYLASTSVLSAAALGELGPAFDADLRRALAPWSDARRALRQEVRFECELATPPPAAATVPAVPPQPARVATTRGT